MMRRRGFSIVEVLVASVVAALLGLVLLRVVARAYRVGREEMERSSTESSLLVLRRRLESDLMDSSPQGLSLGADGSRLAIHRMGEVLDSGRILYTDSLRTWIFTASEKRVVRGELLALPSGLTFDGTPKRLKEAQLLALPPNSGDYRVLNFWDKVLAFKLEDPPEVQPHVVGSPLRMEVEMELPLASTRKTVKTIRTIFLRTPAS